MKSYFNAVISQHMKNLLTPAHFRRMGAAESFDSAAAVLIECGWDENIIKHNTNNEDVIVESQREKFMRLFAKLCPDAGLLKVCLEPSAENLKHIKDVQVREYFRTRNIDVLDKFDVFGLSLPLRWFILNQREFKIVKTILLGKKLELSREKIRQLVGEII